MITRRALVGGLVGATAGVPVDDFEILDLTLPGDSDLARRALVAIPRKLIAGERAPALVLLHGLGETSSDAAGVRAWVDRYGLLSSYARLERPPIAAESKRSDLTPEHAREVNDELRARPFEGRMVLVCPFTPNVWRLADTRGALDRYARWIVEALLPAAAAKAPVDVTRVALDGCSLGGFVGLEVFLRQPRTFSAWGGVQSALREAAAARTAERIATAIGEAGPRKLHLETSRDDPFFAANTALSRELRARSIPHDFVVLPGPHDQPWLREVGTLEMLLWHDRALQGR